MTLTPSPEHIRLCKVCGEPFSICKEHVSPQTGLHYFQLHPKTEVCSRRACHMQIDANRHSVHRSRDYKPYEKPGVETVACVCPRCREPHRMPKPSDKWRFCEKCHEWILKHHDEIGKDLEDDCRNYLGR